VEYPFKDSNAGQTTILSVYQGSSYFWVG